MSAPDTRYIADAVRTACRFDVIAFKPGNVSCRSPGHDMHADDFLAAAAVTAPVLADPACGVGEAILRAVEASVAATGCNTNLGIVLLAAPLTHAAMTRKRSESLHYALARVLAGLDVDDATHAFAAIRRASPGGLGRSEDHDVAGEPSVSLFEAMRAAAVRDRIAWQYVNTYADVFGFGLPLLREYRERWTSLAWAATGVYLGLLRRCPDTHVERKFGAEKARDVSAIAGTLESGFKACENPATFAPELERFDRELKENGVNPGTSADLTVACLIALQLEHTRRYS